MTAAKPLLTGTPGREARKDEATVAMDADDPRWNAPSVREYDAKIWNLPKTPGMFHRQAPGLPMTTRCGLAMGREARSTTHSFAQFNACPVCFEGWAE